MIVKIEYSVRSTPYLDSFGCDHVTSPDRSVAILTLATRTKPAGINSVSTSPSSSLRHVDFTS